MIHIEDESHSRKNSSHAKIARAKHSSGR